MALKEQDVVLYTTDTNGNKIIQMPITRVENVEGAIKTINGVVADDNGNAYLERIVTSVQGSVGDVELIIVSGGDPISVSKSWLPTTTYTYTVTTAGIANISATAGIGKRRNDTSSGDEDPVYVDTPNGTSTLTVSFNGSQIFNKTTSEANTTWTKTSATVAVGDTITITCSRSYNADGNPSLNQRANSHTFSFTMDPMLIVPKVIEGES